MKILEFQPKCLESLSQSAVFTILNNVYSATAKAMDATIRLDKIELSNNLDDEIDYVTYLMDLEDILVPYNVDELPITNDVDNFNNTYYQALALFNDACDLLPADICVATVSTVIQLTNKLKTSLGYLGSALSTIFWVPLEYGEYKKGISKGESMESLADRFPGLEPEMEINTPRVIEEWLASVGKSLDEILVLINTIVVNYPIVGELYYIYADKYRDLKDYLIGLPEEDIIISYLPGVLVQDIDCILNGYLQPDDKYVERLVLRLGDGETISGYTKDDMDTLNKLYTICPEDYKFLYEYEQFILSSDDWVLRVIQAGEITSLLKRELMMQKREDSGMRESFNFL